MEYLSLVEVIVNGSALDLWSAVVAVVVFLVRGTTEVDSAKITLIPNWMRHT
jgi:hypothetical protein